MPALSPLLLSLVGAQLRPRQPTNLTLIALRPLNLSASLDNKDSADGPGDLFFWLTDRLVAPYACRVSNGSWWGCHEQGTLDHDSVYTKSVIEVDGTWPNHTALGRCRDDPGHACYSACNPSDQNGSVFQCGCNAHPGAHGGVPCDVVGRCNIKARYLECADGCHWPNDQWKSDLSKKLGGLWYSTTGMSNCDNPTSKACRWRSLELVKTINATCANQRVLDAIVAKGGDCFDKCPPGDLDRRGDCATLCVFETMLGQSLSFPHLTGLGMTSAELDAPFQAAFASVAAGGCPPCRGLERCPHN